MYNTAADTLEDALALAARVDDELRQARALLIATLEAVVRLQREHRRSVTYLRTQRAQLAAGYRERALTCRQLDRLAGLKETA